MDQFSQIMANFSVINQKMDTFLTEIKAVNVRLDTCEADMKNAYSEIFKLKDQLNDMHQTNRALTVRIFGLPSTEDEASADSGKVTAKLAYDRILKPILSSAKEKTFITSVPTLPNCVTEAFRVKSHNPNSTRPTPIILKLSSLSIKTALFRARKDALPSPTEAEQSAGLKRFHLAEDLTSDSFNCLMELRAHSKVLRAWSVAGEIRFTLKNGDSSHVHKVKSVYDNIDLMLSRM
jgi:hypothetical protein